MAWYSFVTDNPITRTVSSATNYVADKAEDAIRFVTPDVVEEFVEEKVEQVREVVGEVVDEVVEEVTEFAGDTLEVVEEAAFNTVSFVVGGDDDARALIDNMGAQYSMAWEQLKDGEIGNAFGSVVDAQMLAVGEIYFDPDNDTWLSIAGNYAADAGSVFTEEGVLTGSRIFFWEGLVKGSIGATISGIVDLPDTVGDLTGWYNLYDGSVGDDVSGAIWYSWTGGRYEPENENQAKLLGIGTAVGDIASLALTFGGAAAPKVAGWLGRAGKFARAADATADAIKVTSRTQRIMSGILKGGDVITTAVTAPLSVSAEIDRYNEGQLLDVLETQLQEFGVSQEDIDAAQTGEERYNLYIDTVKNELVSFGEDRDELDAMEPQEIEDLFNEYFLLLDAINNPDAEPPRVPADDRIEETQQQQEQEEIQTEQPEQQNGGILQQGNFKIGDQTASLSGPAFTSDVQLEGAFATAGSESIFAPQAPQIAGTTIPRYTLGGVAA